MEYSSSFWCSHPFGLCVYNYPKLKQQQRLRFWERLALFEQKKVGSGFGEKSVRFFAKQVRLWENQRRISGKSAIDFGKIRDRLWENEPPTFGK